MRKLLSALFSTLQGGVRGGLLFLALLATTTLWAHEFSVNGIYYNYLDGNNVKVTYCGDYSSSYDNEYSGEVIIPETVTYNGTTYSVTSIGDWAFYDCSFLTSITIPNSVTSIGNYAFDNCSALTSITIPNSVKSIGYWAFYGCSSLASITIPDSVTSIGSQAFQYCSSLTFVSIGTSVTSIGSYAFNNCTSLTSVVWNAKNYADDSRIIFDVYDDSRITSFIFGNGVEYIPKSVCQNIESLSHVIIAESVKSIGDRAFDDCYSLCSIIIPNSVTSIGEGAFFNSALTSIAIPNSVTSIGDMAFRYCSSLTSVSIGTGVTSIGFYAFADCTSLTSMVVEPGNTKYDSRENCNAIIQKATNTLIAGCQKTVIPNTVTRIAGRAFYHCTSLASITIPNSVTSIGSEAFDGCSSLTSITIPESVESIEWWAFAGCNSIKTIHIKATTPPSIGSDIFSTKVRTAYIPCGTKEAYEDSDWVLHIIFFEEECEEPIDPTWQITYTSTDGNIVTPNKTDVFGANIVSNEYKDGQGVVTFDGPVTSIGDSAFYACSGMALISIPNSVTSIGEWAFYDCSSLTSITIPEGVTSIGENAFCACSLLNGIDIPNGVTRIGSNAFTSCTSLTFIKIPESVVVIENYDGYPSHNNIALNTPNLKSIIVDPNNPVYDSREGCNAVIETATNELICGCQNTFIPNSVASIGYVAFYDCTTLTSIDIPSTVKSIREGAFRNTGIDSVYIPAETIVEDWKSGLIEWNGTFSRCQNLTNITFAEGIKRIPAGVIAYCPNIRSVHIPSSVTSVGRLAFYWCKSLTSITIPESVTSIEDWAFGGCTSLTSIAIPNNVTSIGESAFYYCTSLTSITCKATTPPTLGSSVFPSELTTAYIPCGTKEAYEASDWAQYVSEFVEDCYSNQKCGDNLFWKYNDTQLSITGHGDMYDYDIEPQPWMQYRSKMQTISMPEGMTSIGASAFANCKYVKSIAIPASVEKISDSAFEDCRMLSTITFAGSSVLTHIGNWAFYNNHELTSITIPEGVIEIGYAAFYGCTYLDELTLPASMEYIADNGFALCAKLRRINVNASTPPVVEARTFEDVDRSIPVYVPNTSIELYKAAPVWQEFNIVGKNNTTTDVDNIHSPITNYHKLIRNGQLLILREGKTYNAMGQEVDN